MKKYLSIFIIVILLFSIFSIGYSIWVISSKTLIKPSNVTSDVVKKYLDLSCNNAYTYNGSIQLPTSEVLDISELTFYYKESGSSDYIKCTETIGPKDAGTYEIKVEYKKNTGVDTFETITINPTNNFVISPKSLEVLWSKTTINYDGSPHLPTATITSGLISGDSCNVTVSVDGYASGPTDIGTYSAIATTDNSNYIVSNSPNTFVIKSLSQSLSIEVENNQSVTYNGTAQGPSGIKVSLVTKDSNNTIIQSVDVSDSAVLTYSYYNPYVESTNGLPSDASDYYVNITASYGDYDSFTLEDVEFKIIEKEINLIWSYGTDVIYDGNAHGPTFTSSGVIAGDDCTISVSNPTQTNAGTYEAVAKLSGDKAKNYILYSNNIKYSYTIKPSSIISFVNPTFPKKYYEEDDLTFTGGSAIGINSTQVKGTFRFKYSNKYEYNGVASTSTIPVTLTFNPDSSETNYKSTDLIVNVTMYPVAYISSNYYGTIEKALSAASSGDSVYVIPNLLDSNDLLHPVHIKNDCTISSGVVVNLPYDGTTYFDASVHGSENKFADETTAKVKTNRKTQVIIENGITLSIASGGILNIGGILGGPSAGLSGNTTSSYCEITMATESKIECYGGTINCYGYIKETENNNASMLTIHSGKLHTPFVIYDFKGGAATLGIYNLSSSNMFCPFAIFDVCNIQTTAKICEGSTWETRTLIYIGTNDTYYPEAESDRIINFISPNSSKTALILNSGYITVKYTPKNNGLTEATAGNAKTLIEINGSADIGSLSLSMKVSASIITKNISIDTSKFFFPVSYRLDLTVKSGGTLNITKKVKIMNGCNVFIEEGGIANIKNSMIVYDDFVETTGLSSPYPTGLPSATLTNNGTINVTGSGAIGGFISTNCSNAVLNYNSTNYSVSSPEYGGNMPAAASAVFGSSCDVKTVNETASIIKTNKKYDETSETEYIYTSLGELNIESIDIYNSVDIINTSNYGWYSSNAEVTYGIKCDGHIIGSFVSDGSETLLEPLVSENENLKFEGFYYDQEFLYGLEMRDGYYVINSSEALSKLNGLNHIVIYAKWVDKTLGSYTVSLTYKVPSTNHRNAIENELTATNNIGTEYIIQHDFSNYYLYTNIVSNSGTGNITFYKYNGFVVNILDANNANIISDLVVSSEGNSNDGLVTNWIIDTSSFEDGYVINITSKIDVESETSLNLSISCDATTTTLKAGGSTSISIGGEGFNVLNNMENISIEWSTTNTKVSFADSSAASTTIKNNYRGLGFTQDTVSCTLKCTIKNGEEELFTLSINITLKKGSWE